MGVSGHIIRLKGHTRKVLPHKKDKKLTPRDSPYPDNDDETQWWETYGYYKTSSERRKIAGQDSNHDAQEDLAQWLLNFVPLGVHMKCYRQTRDGHFYKPENQGGSKDKTLHDYIRRCIDHKAMRGGWTSVFQFGWGIATWLVTPQL